MAPPNFVNLNCLTEPQFEADTTGGDPGFGGPETGFNHNGGPIGALEGTPHGSMHVAVGGNFGWMSSFDTAALDPIFWLHHANIDRLWSVWRARAASNIDPTKGEWLTSVPFELHDANGNVLSFTSSHVVDTTAAPLQYRYEDISDPLAPPTEAAPAQPEPVGAAARESGRRAMPEMVGATEGPTVLTGQPVTTRMSTTEPTGPARAARESGAVPRVYLNIENVTGTGRPVSYEVYLNVPPGESPRQHSELYAGLLPMFGVKEASQADQTHPGSGLHYVLEVGRVVQQLRAQNAWNPDDVRITFVPAIEGEGPESARESGAAAPIQVGRVSMYYR
jgi:tyrosinase